MGTKYTSRQSITLDTANNGYYDEVVSMSQGLINKHFETLFDSYTSLKTINFDPPPDRDLASISGTLRAPQMVFNVDSSTNTGEVWYILRIQNATMKKDTWAEDIMMKDWELWAKTSIDSFTLRGKRDGLTQEEQVNADKIRAQQEKEMANLQKTYIIPEGYNVERLYAAIAGVAWSQLDDRSICGKTEEGKAVTWPQWKAKNSTASDHLEMGLKNWATTMQNNGYTMCGVKFVLPKTETVKPTFAPTDVLNQVYRYCNDQYPNGRTSYESPADYNCFLYCENVRDRPIPNSTQLGWTGNYAMPIDEHGNAVQGTFAIHRSIVMEQHFLKQMQFLCQASELLIQDAVQEIKGKSISISPRYSLGCQPTGTPADDLTNAMDSKFAFKRQGGGADAYVYKWSQSESHKSKTESTSWDDGWWLWKDHYDLYQNYDIKGNSNVTVTFHPGKNDLEIKGETSYKYHVWWASDNNGNNKSAYKNYLYRLPWSFTVALDVTTEGELTANFQQLDANNTPSIVAKNDYLQMDNVEGSTETDLERFLQENLRKAIKDSRDRIQKELATSGKFQYPGSGVLMFSAPEFTTQGDLLANITYAPVKNNMKVEVPPPLQLSKPDPPPTKTKEVSAHQPNASPPKLTWNTITKNDYKFDSNTGRLVLTISAKNETKTELGFGWVGIELIANDDHRALYNGLNFQQKQTEGFIEKLADYLTKFWTTVTGGGGSSGASQTRTGGGEKDASSAASSSATLEDTYTLSQPAGSAPLKVTKGYIGTDKLLRCSITSASTVEGQIDMFTLKPEDMVTLTFDGKSKAGTYSYKVHESWKNTKDRMGAGTADATKTVVVVA